MKRAGLGSSLSVLLLLLVVPEVRAATIPAEGTFLTGFGGAGFEFIQDGTSNTVQIGEQTSFAACFNNVGLPPGGITDGTSNTIFLGETGGSGLTGRLLPSAPLGQIVDGTSNTIFIGEITGDRLCLGDARILEPDSPEITDGTSNTIIIGEGSSFDICFRNARGGSSITDGTSNTIFLGETGGDPYCLTGVRLLADAELPEAAALPILGLGLIGLALARRR
ncbi:MAG: hypothetical protein KIT81_17865, partial [Alphaproteobacteria bacterium]|nr:hypothetical protein [Alphaproteobacteria bacterium]